MLTFSLSPYTFRVRATASLYFVEYKSNYVLPSQRVCLIVSFVFFQPISGMLLLLEFRSMLPRRRSLLTWSDSVHFITFQLFRLLMPGTSPLRHINIVIAFYPFCFFSKRKTQPYPTGAWGPGPSQSKLQSASIFRP